MDAKTTVEQFKVLGASQHCHPSSFINILLEYSSTLVQQPSFREGQINRALYHPDTQQCITAFVVVVVDSIYSTAYFMFNVDFDHMVFLLTD